MKCNSTSWKSVSRNSLNSRGTKAQGPPREITFREALVITCGYMRQNIIEDVWADIFDVDQSTISRIITFLTPLVEQATTEFRPAPQEAAEATRGVVALVDGTLWPCWSWDGERELWSGKYKTTGHGSLIVVNLQGRITFVSEPVTGNKHDMAKLKGSAVEEILKKAAGVFGDKGFIGTDYITTLSASQNAVSYCNGNMSGIIERVPSARRSSVPSPT
jgi:DDE superfamily endonuclease/Helix-turn-helix of DDE superfamily endonuclease